MINFDKRHATGGGNGIGIWDIRIQLMAALIKYGILRLCIVLPIFTANTTKTNFYRKQFIWLDHRIQ